MLLIVKNNCDPKTHIIVVPVFRLWAVNRQTLETTTPNTALPG